MAWSREHIERITPPQALDARGRALLQAVAGVAQDKPIREFFVKDPETCPAEALPALIAEMSMEEFIEPGLPEHVQRRILKNAWLLQSMEGYDAGVKLGLGLLGMTAVIEHWWQAEPRRAPNTHVITFFVGEQLFPNDRVYITPRDKKAALRMIDATKRWSQESTVQVGAVLRPHPITTTQRLRGLSLCRRRLYAGQLPPRWTKTQAQVL